MLDPLAERLQNMMDDGYTVTMWRWQGQDNGTPIYHIKIAQHDRRGEVRRSVETAARRIARGIVSIYRWTAFHKESR